MNKAVKTFCIGAVAFGILYGGTNVSAQVVDIPEQIETTTTMTKKEMHMDAGVNASFRNIRDNTIKSDIEKRKAEMVQSGNELDVSTEDISEETEATEAEPETYEIVKEYPITDGNTTKTVLPYKAFGKRSNQAKLQSLCETNEVGLRMYDGRYTIAVGTYFNMQIGQYFDLVLNNGTVIPCIMGDLKADIDTDSRGLFTEASGCMTEFIVDRTYLPNKNSATYCYEEWNSRVVNVVVYNKFVDLTTVEN